MVFFSSRNAFAIIPGSRVFPCNYIQIVYVLSSLETSCGGGTRGVT